MSTISGSSKCKSAELSMVVVRANGDREDLGIVSYYHQNPIKRMIFKIKTYFKKLKTTSNKGK